MSSTEINTEKVNTETKKLQDTEDGCVTYKKSKTFLITVYAVVIVLGLSVAIGTYLYFQPLLFNHPAYEDNARTGLPDIDQDKYGYSLLEVGEGYKVGICGLPANDGQNIEFNLTNPKKNTVWIRAEVLDNEGNILGESGVLKQGEYVTSIKLEKALKERETPVTVRIIGYEPKEWTSRGNVKLNLTVYLDYK